MKDIKYNFALISQNIFAALLCVMVLCLISRPCFATIDNNNSKSTATELNIGVTGNFSINSSDDPKDWIKCYFSNSGQLRTRVRPLSGCDGSSLLWLIRDDSGDPGTILDFAYAGSQEYSDWINISAGWYYLEIDYSSGPADNDYYQATFYYQPPPDTTPPIPNPSQWLQEPFPTSATSIQMSCQVSTDSQTPPVNYHFNFVEGSGGHDSGWISSNVYADTELTPNASYGYEVNARDSSPNQNETTPANKRSCYTYAVVPPAPTVDNPTDTTLDVTPLRGTNPIYTELAIYNKTGGYYVRADGGNNGSTPVWQKDYEWSTVPVTDLSPDTTYEFQVKARNEDLIETSLGSEGSGTTSPAHNIELTLYRVSDTSGTPYSDNPGNEQLYFDPGDTMRITLRARNTGAANVNANWVLNLTPSNDHDNVRFNSDPTPNNTNDKTIPNDGSWYYYSFDWMTDTDDPIGAYDILAAVRSASDWNTILDDTEEGVNTTSLGPVAWLTECFHIGLPVVLVHGFGSNPSEPVTDYWMNLSQLLQDDGFTVIRFDYRDDQSLWNDTRYGIEGIGMQFGLYIRSWCIDYKCPKLNVVSHSMGGLVVRSAMAEMGPVDPDHRESRISIVDYQGHIKRLLTLGTPHYGSPLAELRSILIDYFFDIPTDDVDYLRDEMEPGSRFVWDLRLYTEDNEAEIRDSEIITVVGTSCIIQPFSYPSDCVVENISAAWKDWVGNSNIRVVDESHGGLKDIDTADEDVYKIIKSFCSSSSTWSGIGSEYTDNKAGMLARVVNANTEEVLVADEFKLKNNAPISIWFTPGLNEREMGYECYYVPHSLRERSQNWSFKWCPQVI